jgi:hypothetical protein
MGWLMPADAKQNTRAKQRAHKPAYVPHSAPAQYYVSAKPRPPLKHEQRKVLRKIRTIGKKRGATPKEIKAAVETGLVESNLRNLHYGDSDSQGWRQERKSIYGNPTNLTASIHRFYDETSKLRDKYARAGDLAAAVQRPAAQYKGRYQQRSSDAKRLLKKGRYA